MHGTECFLELQVLLLLYNPVIAHSIHHMRQYLLVMITACITNSFRVTDQSVSSFLLPSGRKLWKERAEKKWLVLVDEQEASESNSPIMALRDALIKVHIYLGGVL